MKKGDIILDFTSLLDVTLIVIFFFVIFSHLDSEDNKARTDAKVNELEMQIQDAKNSEAKANDLKLQLEKEIELVQNSNERQASNLKEMLEYNRSANIKVILDMSDGTWAVRVLKNNDMIAVINSEFFSEEEFVRVLQLADYQEEDTVFCDFVYDGSLLGTHSAYVKTKKIINEVEKKYNYLYCSETDLSIGGSYK